MKKEIVITSPQHPLVKHLVKLRQQRAYRYQEKSCVLIGSKVVEELGEQNLAVRLFVERGKPFPSGLKAKECYEVSSEVLKKISGQGAPESWVVEIAMPIPPSLEAARELLVLDGVADPGNLGTLLRTALAFGWQGVFLLPSCCDPYNDKALAAARGATFRLPWRSGSYEELESILDKTGLPCLVADPQGQALAIQDPTFNQGKCLVLGNEGHGPSAWVKDRGEKVALLMPGNMESLNVAIAGSIFLYLLAPHKTKGALYG